jgi:antitoxin MazE
MQRSLRLYSKLGHVMRPRAWIYIVDTRRRVGQTVDTTYIHRRQAMRAAVKKWGNSAAVRIPASVMQSARMELDEAVDVREESGRIVIEPVRQKTYDLRKLLKDITSKNQHQAVDFGRAMGKEAW